MGISVVRCGGWILSSLLSAIVLSSVEATSLAAITSTDQAASNRKAEQAYVNANSVRFYLTSDKQVSFVPPPGFTQLTDQEIRFKFPSPRPPQYAFGNLDRSVTISITFSQADLAPNQLEHLKQVMAEKLAAIIKRWVTKDLTDINGVPWVRLESVTDAKGDNDLQKSEIHNDMYLTSYNGKMLGFNFNSTLNADPHFRASLLQSVQTIQLTANP